MTAEPLALACDLCGHALPPDGRRCPACGLYRGGFVTTSAVTYRRLAAAFVAVYAATIVIVALAR